MEYVIVGVAIFVVIIMVLSARGKENAIDALVNRYGLSRLMLNQLNAAELSRLRATIKSLEDGKDKAALKKLTGKYKLTD